MLNRREILKSLAVLAVPSTTFLAFWDRVSGISPQAIQWQGTLQLNSILTWKEFDSQLAQQLDISYLESLKKSLTESGAIIKMETRFWGNKVQWTYYFRSQKDYEYWLAESARPFNEGFDFKNYSQSKKVISLAKIDFDIPDFWCA